MLIEAQERQQVLAAVADLLPQLLTSGANNPCWCELHTLLDVPLPGFSLTQPPGAADAIEVKVPAITPEPIKQANPVVIPVLIPEPIRQKNPRSDP
ncbi:hypothetical protein ACFS4T_17180 [Pseudomonas lini]